LCTNCTSRLRRKATFSWNDWRCSESEHAEGLPYVFDSFEVLGTTTVDAAFGDAATHPGPPAQVRHALPLNDTMIGFLPN